MAAFDASNFGGTFEFASLSQFAASAPLSSPPPVSYTWFHIGDVNIGATLRPDGLSAVMLVTVTFVGTLIAAYAAGYMHGDPGYARYCPYTIDQSPDYDGRVGDRRLVERICREHEVDACVHFAALAYVGESVSDPKLYFERNVSDGITLLDALLEERREAIHAATFSGHLDV